jgi:hypothetical protein
MYKMLQRILLVVGVIALLAVLGEIAFSIAATMHGNTPARVIHVNAGPYPLAMSLYKDPANAGYALPFAIAPQQPVSGVLTYDVSSLPHTTVPATPVRASLSPDPNVPNGVQGTAEITVQGTWVLHIVVNGLAGPGEVEVPIVAVAPPAIPDWTGWLIGLIPLYGVLAFLLTQRGRKEQSEQVMVVK